MMSIKKQFLIAGIVVFSTRGYSFSTNLSTNVSEELTTLKAELQQLTQNDNQSLWLYYQQMRDLSDLVKQPEPLYYQLQHLRDFLLEKLESRKQIAKTTAIEFKKNFLNSYQGSGLTMADPLNTNCIGWYQTLDTLSFAYDFPTALTIAVWRKESSCGFYLPNNGDGPFQIVSKEYGTGNLDKAKFELIIKDFLEFSKKKIERYNSKNADTPIQLSYWTVSYEDLYKFAALYNGLSGGKISGTIAPAAPRYFFEKMPGEFEQGKRNGLFLQFLRAIERELIGS